ncbi:MAG: PilT/PilU family type 4a pilus ATPase [Armatimonadota bacterium]|nr:PilT/PilU family type 4a pilus ATPase [Armatimonadota bacterium]MDR7458466.1 PilT/PilU family type 4a pilus ATPase [Armatimonadota bacterium]MDR7478732.1 PilT/PilU family type 4a pilus ATPase [Armatimonadota bacterium]MDR7487940.1 PilT/PilU family type 4a pilus ATPase [Armatimonadota bacterium]MDR7503183.1 PilT/PilU family type 4a pilus ATPase [Armatimonadota bacterium]
MTAPDLHDLLRQMAAHDASDLYLKVGRPPILRVAGGLRPVEAPPLDAAAVTALTAPVMEERHRREFEEARRADIAYSAPGLGRFRVNVYVQRGTPAAVIRRVRSRIPSFEELRLPPAVAELALAPRGLVLVTGQTGSGKSTTLAAMVDYRNRQRPGHIVTVEDPIEFLHEDHRSLVSQREVGTDCPSFSQALRDALRQAPDVILIGEIRDEETAAAAVYFAETGHLVLSTLHASNAGQTLERLLHFFPPERHAGLALQLSLTLNGVLAQRLLPRADGQGRVVAVEVLLATPRVRELLRRGDLPGIRTAMQSPAGVAEGLQTFDHALYELIQAGLVDAETGLRAADSPNDLRLRLKGLR